MTLNIKKGTYVGDGSDDRWITGIGFTPKIVIVRCPDVSGSPYIFVDTYPAGNSRSFAAIALATNFIQGVNSDGFQVGTEAKVNNSGSTIYYLAIGGTSDDIVTGTYTGNGINDRAITGVGFAPWWASTGGGTSPASYPFIRITSFAAACCANYYNFSPTSTNLLKSCDADGFTISSDANINKDLEAYYHFCIKSNTSQIFWGTYTGTGASQTIAGVGFEPSAIWIGINSGYDNMMYSDGFGRWWTDDCARSDAFCIGTTTGYFPGMIKSTNSDGFELGKVAGNYYSYLYSWTAFNNAGDTNFKVKTGTYTGTGVAKGITGLGFQPKVVFVHGVGTGTTNGSMRIDSMNANESNRWYGGTTMITTGITSCDADGFSVDTGATVNSNTLTYYYLALGGSDVVIGKYTGDGTSFRSITGIGFAPVYLVIGKDDGANYIKTANFEDGYSQGFSTLSNNNQFNKIYSLDSDGFSIETDCNSNGVEFYYMAIKSNAAFAIGNYRGDGTDNRNITGVGFNPTSVIVQLIVSGGIAQWKTSDMAGDTTLALNGTTLTADRIQALITDGFQVGSVSTVNTAASTAPTYHFIAFKEDSSPPPPPPVTGNVMPLSSLMIGEKL